MKIENLRKKIDKIDKEIVRLLETRIGIVETINELKNKFKLPLTSTEREIKIIDNLTQLTENKLLQEALPLIYNQIFALSKKTRILKNQDQCPFERIGIIGLGIIGGSILKTLKTKNPKIKVFSLRMNNSDVLLAKKQKLLDGTFPIEELINQSEILILSLPIKLIIPYAAKIRELEKYLNKKLIVIDVGSIKDKIVRKFKILTDNKIEFLGTHPMAGSDKSGFKFSTIGMFIGYPWIITPHFKNEKESIEKVKKFVEYLGSKSYILSSLEHDQIVAKVSHLVFLISTYLFAYVYGTDRNSLKYAGTGFRSTTRLAGGNSSMHSQIFIYNKENIQKELNNFTKFVKETKLNNKNVFQFFIKNKKLKEKYETTFSF
jgi:prephenate dehydrogenase/chorismate mutase